MTLFVQLHTVKQRCNINWLLMACLHNKATPIMISCEASEKNRCRQSSLRGHCTCSTEVHLRSPYSACRLPESHHPPTLLCSCPLE